MTKKQKAFYDYLQKLKTEEREGTKFVETALKEFFKYWEKYEKDGAEFGYNKAKEEMQEQDYSLVDFVMQYENGKFKCKYKSGKEFESVDGKTWKEIVLSKEIE